MAEQKTIEDLVNLPDSVFPEKLNKESLYLWELSRELQDIVTTLTNCTIKSVTHTKAYKSNLQAAKDLADQLETSTDLIDSRRTYFNNHLFRNLMHIDADLSICQKFDKEEKEVYDFIHRVLLKILELQTNPPKPSDSEDV